MRKTVLLATLFTLFTLVAALVPANAQHGGEGIFKNPEFEIRAEDGVITIPFKTINNHLIFPLSVRGETFDVILDTGMPISALLLFATDRVEKLDLNFGAMQVAVAGAGGGDPIPARLAQGETVDIGKLHMQSTTLLVMPPMTDGPAYHEGIIGAALFENFVVNIDYDTRTLQLHDVQTYKVPQGAIQVPLSFHGQRRVPYAHLNARIAGGRTADLEVVVDLGASHAVSINMDTIEKFELPARTIPTKIGHGIGGEVLGRVGRIESLRLGGIELPNVVATFPISEHQHPGGMDSKNGNLGSGILKRFDVTFDYARERMLLKPNRSFTAPFEWDMSGMRLDAEASGLRIGDVVAESPAARAGLALNDVVTHINGTPASAANMYELREELRREGAEITIRATREGQPLTVTLTLQRLV